MKMLHGLHINNEMKDILMTFHVVKGIGTKQ